VAPRGSSRREAAPSRRHGIREERRGKTGGQDDDLPGGRDDFSQGTAGLSRIREQATYPLKGRPAILEVGVGVNGKTCSRISWREKDVRITVLAILTPIELMKVAESMLR
jgi:hypothetical protein